MFGLLNINKPTGPTSRDIVNSVQRLVRPEKVGHAGTLDPLADGVLILCVGAATRLVEYVQFQPKEYIGVFRLGFESDTEDIQGDVRQLENGPDVNRAELQAALPQFVGTIQQTPPSYSAIKVKGQRAYALARRGEKVELKSRPVTIDEIELLDFVEHKFTLRVRCHSGTYIRSLGRDVGRALNSGAVMESLTRTMIGPWKVSDAVGREQLDSLERVKQSLLPIAAAVSHLPSYTLTDDEYQSLSVGGPLTNRLEFQEPEIAGFDKNGELAAILKPFHDGELLRPAKNFFGK